MLCLVGEERRSTGKTQFVPFVNERDFMGSLLSKNAGKLRKCNTSDKDHLEYIANLKKSTREYEFDKQFKKMSAKLHRIKCSLEPKDCDWDAQVDSCYKSLDQVNGQNRTDPQFYIDLHQRLQSKIQLMKTQISFHSKHKENSILFSETISKKKYKRINTELFKKAGPRSGLMADFTNCGFKYQKYVKDVQTDPWKKWYVHEEIEVFPGEKIKMTRLQKSIY